MRRFGNDMPGITSFCRSVAALTFQYICRIYDAIRPYRPVRTFHRCQPFDISVHSS